MSFANWIDETKSKKKKNEEKNDELDCDLIVLGTHGKGLIAHTFLGSTSKRVLRRTRKPVFIIPLPKGELDITFHDF